MKAGLYEPVEFNTRLSVAEAAARLQKNEVFDPRQWRCEVQGDRFQLTPINWELSAKHRALWPEVFGFLTPHGSDTAVRLAFRPTADGWTSWAFAVLCVLISLIFAAVTGGLALILNFAVWDVLLFLFCALIVRHGKKTAVETVRQILESK